MRNLRFDRLLSLGMVRPALKLMGPSQQSRLPILMYHGIRNVSRPARGYYFETSTSPEMFAAQMRFLHENGYQTIRMSEAFRMAMPSWILENGSQ